MIFQNIVFSNLIDILEENNGIVLQMLGDGLMALFGAPTVKPDHALDAVNASFSILDAIQKLANEGKIPKIRIGIGLNSGNIIAGNLGNEKRKAYSITGKNVIIAARIESLNKQFKSQFLISESVYEAIPSESFQVKDLGQTSLKGIEKPVNIYQLK